MFDIVGWPWPPAMERREPNHVAQKTAIPGLLDGHIRVTDGRDSVASSFAAGLK